MTERKMLIESLIEQTYKIKNAIEAKELEAFEKFIDARGKIIEDLESCKEPPISEEELALLKKFTLLEEACETLYEEWRELSLNEWNQIRVEKMQLIQNKKAFNQYNQSSAYNAQGYTLDQKK